MNTTIAPLTPEKRKALVTEAIRRRVEIDISLGEVPDPPPASFFESMDDHGLRVFGDDLSADEWDGLERNSDWISEMEDAKKEADRKAGIP
jgi:hypothetical protein